MIFRNYFVLTIILTALPMMFRVEGVNWHTDDQALGISGCGQDERAINTPYVERDVICGKLVFLKDLNTNTQYLALSPCGDARTIFIFKVRPKELYRIYRFRDPHFTKGPKVSTDYGKIDDYISNFESYIPLENCGECSMSFIPTAVRITATGSPPALFYFPTFAPPLPTKTLRMTPTITRTSTEIPPSPTLAPTETKTEKPIPHITELGISTEMDTTSSDFRLLALIVSGLVALFAIVIGIWLHQRT